MNLDCCDPEQTLLRAKAVGYLITHPLIMYKQKNGIK